MPRTLIFVLLVLPALVVGALYMRYRQVPAVRWAGRVRGRVGELNSRRDALRNPASREQSPAEKLADELFRKQRQTVSASALQKYDGIGPKTVEWLKSAGITNLEDADQHVSAFLFKKKIENLGEVREASLKAAVHELLQAERRRFEAGTSPEGAEYQRRLANLSAEEQDRAAAKRRELTALDQCLDRMREFEAIADRVNFTGWVLRQPLPVTDEVMNRTFPAVEIADAPPAAAPVSTTSTPSVPTAPSAPVTPTGPPPQLAKLQAYCRFALLVAKADNRIVASERGRIRTFLTDRFGSDNALLRHIDPQIEQAEAVLTCEEDAIAAIKAQVPREEWPSLYDFAVQVADAAGGRNAKETQYLADLAVALGLDVEAPANAAPVSSPPPVTKPTIIEDAKPEPRSVLEIDAKTPITAELVRRKYALLMDRAAKAKALGGEFAKAAALLEATGKTAAESLLAPLDEPLTAPVPEAPKDIRHNPDLDDLFK